MTATIADHRHLLPLKPGCEFRDGGGDTVRMSDCDSNHHMTSAGYLSLACDALGYWSPDEERQMRFMQVDFRSEVRPGTFVKYEIGEENGLRYMRGIKDGEKIAFVACCDY